LALGIRDRRVFCGIIGYIIYLSNASFYKDGSEKILGTRKHRYLPNAY
jgi:hypothetical protein